MRKLTLGCLGVLMAFFATAQISKVGSLDGLERVADHQVLTTFSGKTVKSNYKQGGQLAAPGDTIFYSNFNSAAFWTAQASGTTKGWIIGDSVPWAGNLSGGINSTSGKDWACLKPGDPRPGALPGSQFNLTSNSISTLGKTAVILSFETRYVKFEDTAKVEISTDGINFTEVYNFDWLPVTSVSNGQNPTANPLKVVVNVTKLAGNKSSVFIRFNWKSRQAVQPGIGYGWYIDDVMLSEGNPNDVSIVDAYAMPYTDCKYSHFNFNDQYSKIPLRQANATQFGFGGKFENLGGANQTNLKLRMNATGPNGFSAMDSSAGTTLLVGAADSLSIAGPLTYSGGKGMYTTHLYATSNANLSRQKEDTATLQFEITDTSYTRVRKNPSTGSNSRYYDPARVAGWEFAQLIQIKTIDTLSSISFFLDGLNARRANKQGSISAHIYKIGNDYSCDTIAASIVGPLFSSDTVKVPTMKPVAGGTWVTFPIKDLRAGSSLDTVSPGNYMVSVQADQFFGADTVFFGYHAGFHRWHNFARLKNNGSSSFDRWFVSPNQYYIQLNTKATPCPVLNGQTVAKATTSCGASNGEATVVDPTNGSGVYNYRWSAPGNPTTKKITGLKSGVYTVTITDALGCSQVAQATVSDAGAPSIASQNITNVLCAGKKEGKVTLSINPGAAGPGYKFYWFDSKGDTIKIGSGATTADSVLSGVEAGQYSVVIYDNGVPPCKQSGNYTVTGATEELTVLRADRTINHANCNGDSNGSIVISKHTGGTGNVTYAWSNNQTGASIQNLTSGNYTFTVTDANGCKYSDTYSVQQPDPYTVTDATPPPTTSEMVYSADSLVCTITPRTSGGNRPGAETFKWYPAGTTTVLTSNSSTGVIEIGEKKGANQEKNGDYECVATDSKGCVAKRVFTVGKLKVSLEYFGKNVSMMVFPNPSNGLVNLKMVNVDNNTYNISVKNMVGQVVYTNSAKVAGDYNEVIDLGSNEAGVYFLTVENDKGSVSYKIVVE